MPASPELAPALVALLLLRFLLGLALLGVLGFWGWRAGGVMGLIAPLGAALIWGLFISPNRPLEIGRLPRFSLEILLFALGAAALWQLGRPLLAALFLVLALAQRLGLIALRRRALALEGRRR